MCAFAHLIATLPSNACAVSSVSFCTQHFFSCLLGEELMLRPVAAAPIRRSACVTARRVAPINGVFAHAAMAPRRDVVVGASGMMHLLADATAPAPAHSLLASSPAATDRAVALHCAKAALLAGGAHDRMLLMIERERDVGVAKAVATSMGARLGRENASRSNGVALSPMSAAVHGALSTSMCTALRLAADEGAVASAAAAASLAAPGGDALGRFSLLRALMKLSVRIADGFAAPLLDAATPSRDLCGAVSGSGRLRAQAALAATPLPSWLALLSGLGASGNHAGVVALVSALRDAAAGSRGSFDGVLVRLPADVRVTVVRAAVACVGALDDAREAAAASHAQAGRERGARRQRAHGGRASAEPHRTSLAAAASHDIVAAAARVSQAEMQRAQRCAQRLRLADGTTPSVSFELSATLLAALNQPPRSATPGAPRTCGGATLGDAERGLLDATLAVLPTLLACPAPPWGAARADAASDDGPSASARAVLQFLDAVVRRVDADTECVTREWLEMCASAVCHMLPWLPRACGPERHRAVALARSMVADARRQVARSRIGAPSGPIARVGSATSGAGASSRSNERAAAAVAAGTTECAVMRVAIIVEQLLARGALRGALDVFTVLVSLPALASLARAATPPQVLENLLLAARTSGEGRDSRVARAIARMCRAQLFLAQVAAPASSAGNFRGHPHASRVRLALAVSTRSALDEGLGLVIAPGGGFVAREPTEWRLSAAM